MALSLSSLSCIFHASPTISTKIPINNRNIPLGIHLRRSPPQFAADFVPRNCRRRALSPGRPPPPGSEPPPNGNESGATSNMRLQESMRIFFAVLFWMALFFWSSVWDGKNNDGGTGTRPRKGSWFRK